MLDYYLDIDERSYSIAHTAALAAKKLPFYLEVEGYYNAGTKYYTKRDDLDSYLIIFTISGEGFLSYTNREAVLKAGSFVMIRCKEYQFYKNNSKNPWEFKWFHINGFACSEYFNLINDKSLNIIETNKPLQLSLMFDRILNRERKGGIGEDISISNDLSNIITDIALEKLQPGKNNQYKIEIDNVIDFIINNYNKKICVDDFVNIVYISKYYFLRIFKKYTGLSPYEYLTNYRIKISKNLLSSSDLSIIEVSEKIGYSNVNIFIRDFKKYVGLTPKKYKLTALYKSNITIDKYS